MRLNLPLPFNLNEEPDDWAFVLDFARLADRCGADRLVIGDHIVFGEDLDAYGRAGTGGRLNSKQPTGPDGYYIEPLITLATVAGATNRVRLGTSIILAALRRPVVLAKAAATLDVLSGGRLDLGVGVGWQEAEYVAAGLDFSKRGRQLDHTIEVCQVLWRERRASYETPELTFENIHAMPKPSQPGGVPIWIGGRPGARTARRLALFGGRWITWDVNPDTMAQTIAAMRQQISDEGGNGAALQVQGELYLERDSDGRVDVAATMSIVPTLAEAGVTELTLWRFKLPTNAAHAQDEMVKTINAFRSAVGRDLMTDVAPVDV